MDRRDFLKFGVAIAGSKLMPNSGHAQQPSRKRGERSTYAVEQPSSRFTSTPDDGIRLENPGLAYKVRRLADYVDGTMPNQPGLVSYNPHFLLNDGRVIRTEGVQAILNVDGDRYTIEVLEEKEKPQLSHINYTLTISAERPNRPQPTDTTILAFTDNGLDGLVNFGGLSTRFDPNDNRMIIMRNGGWSGRSGLVHRGLFMRLYEQTLDRLIAFYEQTNR